MISAGFTGFTVGQDGRYPTQRHLLWTRRQHISVGCDRTWLTFGARTSVTVCWSGGRNNTGGCSGVPGISDGFFVASGGIDAELSDLTRWPTSRPTNCIGPAGHRPAAHPVDGQPRRAPRRAVHLLRAAHRWDGHDIPSRLLVFAGDLPIRDEPLPRFLDDAAVTTLLQAARSDADPFVRLTVEFLARTGLRKGEFLDLTIDSVVLIGSAYWLHVPLGKLRTDRYIPLHPATGRPARHLARHPPQHSPSHCLLLKDGHRIAQNRGRPRRRQGRPHRRRRPRHPSENDPGLMSSDPVMPERCQRLSTMRTPGHHEQCGAR